MCQKRFAVASVNGKSSKKIMAHRVVSPRFSLEFYRLPKDKSITNNIGITINVIRLHIFRS